MTESRARVLFLTKYARNGASSRQRSFQYLPWFEEAGIECRVSRLVDEAYPEHRYGQDRARWTDVALGIWQRLQARGAVVPPREITRRAAQPMTGFLTG